MAATCPRMAGSLGIRVPLYPWTIFWSTAQVMASVAQSERWGGGGGVGQVGEVHNRARTGRGAAVVTPEHGGQLLPGDLAVRGEGGGAGTLDDPFLLGPGHSLGVPGVGGYVGEGDVAGNRWLPGHAVEDGGHHGTGHGGVGRECGLTGALHDAGGIEVAGSSGGVVGGRVFVGVDQGVG